MTILEQLAGYARERTEKAKQKRPLSTLRQQAFSMPKGSFAFENAIKNVIYGILSIDFFLLNKDVSIVTFLKTRNGLLNL